MVCLDVRGHRYLARDKVASGTTMVYNRGVKVPTLNVVVPSLPGNVWVKLLRVSGLSPVSALCVGTGEFKCPNYFWVPPSLPPLGSQLLKQEKAWLNKICVAKLLYWVERTLLCAGANFYLQSAVLHGHALRTCILRLWVICCGTSSPFPTSGYVSLHSPTQTIGNDIQSYA